MIGNWRVICVPQEWIVPIKTPVADFRALFPK